VTFTLPECSTERWAAAVRPPRGEIARTPAGAVADADEEKAERAPITGVDVAVAEEEEEDAVDAGEWN
jgi:hypothetical protein